MISKEWIARNKVNLLLSREEFDDVRYQTLLKQINLKNRAKKNMGRRFVQFQAKYNVCFFRLMQEEFGEKLTEDFCRTQELTNQGELADFYKDIHEALAYDIKHPKDKRSNRPHGIFQYEPHVSADRREYVFQPLSKPSAAELPTKEYEDLLIESHNPAFRPDYKFTKNPIPDRRFFYEADL
jgi:hypothetical protein